MALVPLEDARREILAAVAPLTPVEWPGRDALGLVLAADVATSEAVPPSAPPTPRGLKRAPASGCASSATSPRVTHPRSRSARARRSGS